MNNKMSPVFIKYSPNENRFGDGHEALYIDNCTHQTTTDILRVVENVDKYNHQFKCDFKVLILSGIYNIFDSFFEETLKISDEIVKSNNYFIKSQKMTLKILVQELNKIFKLISIEIDQERTDNLYYGYIKTRTDICS